MKNKLTITKYYDNKDAFTKPVLSSLNTIFMSNTYLNNISFLKYNTKNIGLVKINGIIYDINNIPDNLKVDGYLDLSNCTSLISLSDNLKVDGWLNLLGCTSLTHLPDNLTVNGDLDLSYCTSLTSLPDNLIVNGNLYLFYCTSLTHLPDNLTINGWLSLSGCTSLKISDDRYKKLQIQVKDKIYK